MDRDKKLLEEIEEFRHALNLRIKDKSSYTDASTVNMSRRLDDKIKEYYLKVKNNANLL